MPPTGMRVAPPARTPLAPQHLPALADPARCQRWLAEIDAALDRAARPADAAIAGPACPPDTSDPPCTVQHGHAAERPRPGHPMHGQDPVRPCSLPLSTLPALFDELAQWLSQHPRLRPWLDALLGPGRHLLLADHCFVRHQPAPRHRQPGQHPHSWHQDGALGVDFLREAGGPPAADALATMATCWLPLRPCGDGIAPSLAWVTPSLDRLWPLALLNEAAIARELADGGGALQALHTARLAAGDALVFGGGSLHRTHTSDDMAQPRTSVELRWLPADAVPARLAGERLLPVR